VSALAGGYRPGGTTAGPINPGLLVFHENWGSKADLDAHPASAHIDAFRAIAPDLLAEPPDITLWSEVKD